MYSAPSLPAGVTVLFFWHWLLRVWAATSMRMLWHWNITGPLWRESIADRWILLTKGQHCTALMFPLIYAPTNCWPPLCKSNGTFFSDMDINELTSVLHKYKTPVTKCCILTCWVNLVCIRHLIVKIMPEKHVWGPDFLMSDSLYIFQLFEN